MRKECNVERVRTHHNSVLKMTLNQTYTIEYDHETYEDDLKYCVTNSVMQCMPYTNGAAQTKTYTGRSTNMRTAVREMGFYMDGPGDDPGTIGGRGVNVDTSGLYGLIVLVVKGVDPVPPYIENLSTEAMKTIPVAAGQQSISTWNQKAGDKKHIAKQQAILIMAIDSPHDRDCKSNNMPIVGDMTRGGWIRQPPAKPGERMKNGDICQPRAYPANRAKPGELKWNGEICQPRAKRAKPGERELMQNGLRLDWSSSRKKVSIAPKQRPPMLANGPPNQAAFVAFMVQHATFQASLAQKKNNNNNNPTMPPMPIVPPFFMLHMPKVTPQMLIMMKMKVEQMKKTQQCHGDKRKIAARYSQINQCSDGGVTKKRKKS